MSFNSVTLVGCLGRDAELKSVGTDSCLSFSLAVNETWKDREGNKQERTDWVNCDLFGKRADALAKYLTKGKMILVQGRLRIDKVEKDGNTNFYTKVRVNEVEFVGGGAGSSASAQKSASTPVAPPPASDYASGGTDEEIPF